MSEKTEAQKRAQQKYLQGQKFARVRVSEAELAEIKKAADAAGESVSAYMLEAVRDRMDIEAAQRQRPGSERRLMVSQRETLKPCRGLQEATGSGLEIGG